MTITMVLCLISSINKGYITKLLKALPYGATMLYLSSTIRDTLYIFKAL